MRINQGIGMQDTATSGLALELVCRSLAQQLWLLEDVVQVLPQTAAAFELQQLEVRTRFRETFAQWCVVQPECSEGAWVNQVLAL